MSSKILRMSSVLHDCTSPVYGILQLGLRFMLLSLDNLLS